MAGGKGNIHDCTHCVPESLVPLETPGGYTLDDFVPARLRRKKKLVKLLPMRPIQEGDGGDESDHSSDDEKGGDWQVPLNPYPHSALQPPPGEGPPNGFEL